MTKVLNPQRVYVCGFMFANNHVLLIKKLRPDWQCGKLNGIGGEVEDGESEGQAMRREFREETGIDCDNWQRFCVLRDERGWAVHFFYGVGNIYSAQKTTDEEPVVLECTAVQFDGRPIPNLRWLIPMAQSMADERIDYFQIQEQRIYEPKPST